MNNLSPNKLFKRRKFTYRNLGDSGALFCKYADLLNLTLKYSYKKCLTNFLKGYSYFDCILHNINAYNRCFEALAKQGEIVAAYPLLRIVADNIRIMVAEYLYPEKILPAIFENDKELNQIIVKGKKLNPSDITKATTKLFPEFDSIYKEYSGYVHPSKSGNVLGKIYGEDKDIAREVKRSLKTIKRTKAEWDLVKLNQTVIDLLLLLIERNKKIIMESDKIKYKKELVELTKRYTDNV